jgi:pimeloyl-ACP methyl ester carboxylesterase
VIAAVDGFLTALGEDGPFLLLGASFGGLVASAYAIAHPDRVAGVVLLDSDTGDSYEFEKKGGFQRACLPENREADANDSLEKLDDCSLAKWI